MDERDSFPVDGSVMPPIPRGNPADVVLADETSHNISPSTSADPSTPTTPQPSTSTNISAPFSSDNLTNQIAYESTDNTPQAQLERPDSQAELGTISGSRGLRRRRRHSSPHEHEQIRAQAGPSSLTGPPTPGGEHRHKRIRVEPMMRSEGDDSNTNGASRPFSNGSSASAAHKVTISNATNGTHKSSAAVNGSFPANGHHVPNAKSPRPSYLGHDREEVSRILLQALSDLGYTGAAGTLSQESGYELESPAVAAFRNAVLQGEWAEAEELLFGDNSAPAGEEGSSGRSYGLTLAEGVDKAMMRFWLRQQKFLELLEERDTGRALMVLRTELTPLYQDTGKLHFLSSLIMCQSTDDLKSKADWDGAHGQSRHQLLSDLSRCISPSVMIPEHRLVDLLQQVKDAQIWNCQYHSAETSPSLYCDHRCDRSNFPLRVVRELDKHTGEVWHIQFSHNGFRLASCGQDGTAIIYSVETFEVLQTLTGHSDGVTSVAWSPDDTMIITCSLDKKARLFNSNTGEQIRIISQFDEPPSCVWAPDGQTFVTGSLYVSQNLCQWNVKGDLVYDWGRAHRIQDIALSPDGNRLVAMDASHHIHIYNFVTRELEYEMDLKVKLSSVSISRDSMFLLVSKSDGEARIFNLETRESVRKFVGPKGGTNVVRSNFGGANESFVTSGSEDGFVYIWHMNGSLLEKLDGHGPGVCSGIAWNPTNPCMFASGGDDMKVRIWGNGVAVGLDLKAKGRPTNNESNRTANGWRSME